MTFQGGPGGQPPSGERLVAAAFRVAARSAAAVAPLHLLIALAELDDGTIGAMLLPLRPASTPATGGATTTWIFAQTQAAAIRFAQLRHDAVAAPHLVLAVVDQGDAEAMRALVAAGIDPQRLRRVALDQLGLPADLAPIDIPAPTPAGTGGRPPLPVADLDGKTWAVLRWRQAHLPLHRVRTTRHAEALSALESRAAWRLADRGGVDDDQRYSLLWHHDAAVTARLDAARPRTLHPRPADGVQPRVGYRRDHRMPAFPIGWSTWFGNRRVDVRNGWFAARTAGAYRGQPTGELPRSD